MLLVRLYAASAYLKALAGKYDAFEQHYRQLAYAMNDPMEHCTYNSDTIFRYSMENPNQYRIIMAVCSSPAELFLGSVQL